MCPPPKELSRELARRERELEVVRRITASLHARTSLDDLVRETLAAAIETVEASAGSILLHDPESDRLVFRYVSGPSEEIRDYLTGRAIDAGEGVGGAVFRSGHGTITRDAAAEARHSREIDLATHYRTRNMVTVPVMAHGCRPIGVMQILNRREGTFDEDDLVVLEILSGQAASAIETAGLHARLLEAEVHKKRFTAEVLRCVTQERLNVVDPAFIPEDGDLLWETALAGADWFAAVRSALAGAAEEAGMSEEAAADLVLAVGEAATNAIKHAGGGCCALYQAEDRLAARVSDSGTGIRPEDLPAAVLQAGFSTAVSLGMGFTVMLRTVDRIWLATGPSGTVVQLEKWLRPGARAADALERLLERF